MDKRGSDKNAERSNVIHYVAKKNTVLNRISGTCDVNISPLCLGMLVEAIEVLRDGGLRIRITDPAGSEVWQNTEWLCHRYDLVPVSSIMWQYLAGVPTPQDRVKLATDKQLCKDLNDIKLNSKVFIRSEGNLTGAEIPAVIKYIGPVPEIGSGFYFGLEILGNRQVSQNAENTRKYFTTSQGNGIFVNLSIIRPYKNDSSDFGEPDQRRNANSDDNLTGVWFLAARNEYFNSYFVFIYDIDRFELQKSISKKIINIFTEFSLYSSHLKRTKFYINNHKIDLRMEKISSFAEVTAECNFLNELFRSKLIFVK